MQVVDRCIVCGGEVAADPVMRAHDRLFESDERFAVHDCRRCGLGITRPRPVGDELAAYYPDSYPSWRTPRGLRGLATAAKAQVVARVPPYGRQRARRGGRMLDVGLGRGDIAQVFVRSGWDVHGLDMSPMAVQAARLRGVDARVGTLEDAPPWPPGTFDLVVCSHVLEHVADPLRELRIMRELLAPGGVAIVAVPAWESWQRRAFGSRWSLVDVPRHLQHFTVPALNEAATAAGFARGRVRRCTSMAGIPVSTQFALAGRWPLGPRWRTLLLGTSVAAYPLVWALGRAFGGDCTYLELHQG